MRRFYYVELQLSNCQCFRNENLMREGFTPSKTRKSGTSICGIVIDGGVVLGADTRATSGNMVFEKKCEKIYFVQNNMA